TRTASPRPGPPARPSPSSPPASCSNKLSTPPPIMSLLASLQSAAAAGHLLPSTLQNLETWLAAGLPAWATASLEELVARQAWAELNDRFYRDLEFGTGGMRGRTIGRVSTAAEQGEVGP